MKRLLLLVAGLLLITSACSDTAGPISEAICNDLDNGFSIFQIKAETQKTREMSPEEFAGFLYGHVAVGCPSRLQDPTMRTFLKSWGVNPDA